jgi:hypothetical protein
MNAGSQMINTCALAYIDGEQHADQFITDLTTHIAIGDELHHLVNQHTASLSPEHDAFLRGLLRRIEKRLENLS